LADNVPISTRPILFTPLLAVTMLPVVVASKWRRTPPPDGMANVWNCSVCGSNLFGGGWPESESSSVRLSAFGADYDRKPEAHTFVRSVAAWEILPDDGLPRFDERAT